MEAKLAEVAEWTTATVFDAEGKVLAGTEIPSGEIQSMLSAFDERDLTVGKGLVLDGHHFEVHRWYEHLIYGRRGDFDTGVGICLHRVNNTARSDWLFMVITYTLPVVSARAIPILLKFSEENCTV